MPNASYVQTSFLGGEWSQTAQGRMDDPHYRTALALMQNVVPTEQGAAEACSGSQFLATTRGGARGRVMSFAVNDENPIMLEFTDGFLRFYNFVSGVTLALTGAALTVTAISADNPAKVTVSGTAPATGASVMFFGLGANNPLLQNRVFLATNIDGTHFTIADAITGAGIDGSTLGTFVSGTVGTILEIATNYAAQTWAGMRLVQAQAQAVLLNGTAPQVLTMTSPPGAQFPAFTFDPAVFIDGPYLDPFNGSICTYDTTAGNVTLTFSFQAYEAFRSYSKGDFVVSAGQGYQSLIDANLGNTPAGSPSVWAPVNGGAPVGPNGFTSADIGRHIRLFSEPAGWVNTSSYAIDAVVKYNDAYWSSLVANNTGSIPGTDASTWLPVTGVNYAVWTWGRIISVSGTGKITVGTPIGSMSNVAGAFNGSISQGHTSSASATNTQTTFPQWGGLTTPYSSGTNVYDSGNFYGCIRSFAIYSGGTVTAGDYYNNTGVTLGANQVPPGFYFHYDGVSVSSLGAGGLGNSTFWGGLGAAQAATFNVYAGADFHTSPKVVSSVTVFPSNDLGIGYPGGHLTLTLRGKQTFPTSPGDGTPLGSASSFSQFPGAISITSNDQVTAWNYVWVQAVSTVLPPLFDDGSHNFTTYAYIAQIEFFTPNINNGSVVTIQLVGPLLLYPAGTVVNTWRAGVFGATVGWPTNGCYFQGRLWLSGAQFNRLDASMSDDIFNFAPTLPDGTVADNNGISYTLNSRGVNTIFWMEADGQGIIVGTDGGEFLIPGTPQNPITPANISAAPVTKADCANIEPVRSEHTLLVVQARMRKVLEQFADIFSGKFTVPNLMDKARHLTAAGIAEIRYQREITPTIWARMADGTLAGGSYKRDTLMTSSGPTFMAWWRRVLGSGRQVESIAVGPSQNGTLDALVMVTNDPVTGIRHVELQADLFEETDSFANAWLLDDAVTPASYVVTANSITINGLWHLNGKTVQVFAAGLDCGAQMVQQNGILKQTYVDFTVANGSITVGFGDGIAAGPGNGLFTQAFVNSFPAPAGMPLVVGFANVAQIQLLRPASPAESGARNGPAVGKLKRHHYYVVQAVNANGWSIGESFAKLDPIVFKPSATKVPVNLPALFSGVARDNVRGDYTFDGQLCLQKTRPVPGTFTAIGGMLETMDT